MKHLFILINETNEHDIILRSTVMNHATVHKLLCIAQYDPYETFINM